MLNPKEFFSKNRNTFLFLAIFAIGAGLRVFRLDYQSFWNDELLTLKNIGVSFVQLITQPRDPNIMPLFYFFIHPLKGLENQEFWLRLVPMVFGCITIILVFFVGRNLLGKRVGLFGAFLIAISPFHIWYSQEARPYALLIMISLLSVLLLQHLMKNDSRLLPKIVFVFVTAALFYSHPVGIAVIGFEATYLLLNERKRWKEWLLVFGCVGLLLFPGLYRMLIISPDASANTHYVFNPFAIAYTGWAFGTGYSLGPNMVELHMPGRSDILFSYLPLIAPVMIIYFTLFALGIVQLHKKGSAVLWFTTFWLIFPVAFAVLGSIYSVHPFNVRYAILAFPAFILVIASGIYGLNKGWLRSLALLFLCVISFWSLKGYFFNEEYHRENNRAAGEFLTEHANEGDLILGTAAYTIKNLKYYYRGNHNLTFVGYPSSRISYTNGSEVPGALFVNEKSLETELMSIIADKESFWLFLSRTFHSDPYDNVRSFCKKNFSETLHGLWSGAELIRFEKKKQPPGSLNEK